MYTSLLSRSIFNIVSWDKPVPWLGLELYEKVKDELRTDEGRAFSSFYKMAFESAKKSIPANTVPIRDVNGRDTKQELFQIFTNINEVKWNGYLPDHPTIKKFRTLICDILRRAQDNTLIPKDDDLIPNFIINFDITLEQEVDTDPDIRPFKEWYRVVEGTKNLRRHLQDSRLLFDRTNSIDQKPLKKYYVENNAVLLTDLETWEKEEENYGLNERKATDFISDFLKEKPWYTVIGAPFGIGKTSFAIYLTSYFASKYLEDPDNQYNYIPIFVPKGKLTNIDEHQSSLDDKLRSIAGEGEGKKKKILIICDELDEYGDNESKLTMFRKKHSDDHPNIKVIITTRLKAGLLGPQKLDVSSYIRLLPFNKEQVTKFFEKYGLPDITFDLLESYNLKKQEISKPLFCWMFAIMRNYKSFDITTVFKNVDSRAKRSMSRALIYQGFIHSIVRGKHESKATETRYQINEEKRILRKIAALRQMRDPLTKSRVIEGLKYYDISYDEVLDPILTSYFYLQSITATDMYVDFIHKSFTEYFLAEYYLESILNNKGHYLNSYVTDCITPICKMSLILFP